MEDKLGALLCKMDKTVDVGDHRLLIAKVEDIMRGDDTSGALSYSDRKYRHQGDPVWPHDPDQDEE
jgi:flavin reductase (DIM6/NTAB) family NADH-FMN oxidoreductase RutF